MLSTTVRIGKCIYRIPELMIHSKDIIDERANLFRIVISDINADKPEKYSKLFQALNEEKFIDIEFNQGKYTIEMVDAYISKYIYPYGTIYEIEADEIKERKIL